MNGMKLKLNPDKTEFIIVGDKHTSHFLVFLDGSKDSLVAALNIIEIFRSLSGLKVNTEKTKIIWLGRMKHSRGQFEIKQ